MRKSFSRKEFLLKRLTSKIPLLIKSLAKWETPLSTVVRSTKMGYQIIPLLRPVVHIYVAFPDFASAAQTN